MYLFSPNLYGSLNADIVFFFKISQVLVSDINIGYEDIVNTQVITASWNLYFKIECWLVLKKV